MTQKRAAKLSLIILLVSLGLIATSAIFRKIWPQLTTSYRLDAGLDARRPDSELPLQELDLDQVKPNSNNIPAWPAESCLPEYRNTDMSLYANRSKNQEALKGILVFIDPARGGQDQGYNLKTTGADGKESRLFSVADQNLKLAVQTQKKLEALGAKVILLRSTDMDMSDLERVGRLAHYLIDDFISELAEREFVSQRLTDLRFKLAGLIADQDQDGLGQIFTSRGASRDLRLILDLEKQYKDMCYLRIDHQANSANTGLRGFSINIMDQEKAAELGQAESPAYMNYLPDRSKLLAQSLETEMISLIPELKIGQGQAVNKQFNDMQRFVNLKMIEFSPGYLTNSNDLFILLSPERQDIIAEALTNSIYREITSEDTPAKVK